MYRWLRHSGKEYRRLTHLGKEYIWPTNPGKEYGLHTQGKCTYSLHTQGKSVQCKLKCPNYLIMFQKQILVYLVNLNTPSFLIIPYPS